ncbi:MAG TPA: TIGR01777 family oxidoreductase, partial [bacterium]|nr:TIGR01777 family oxidoreductase [bacterium]
GDVPEGDVDETRHASDDFLGRTCAAWENEVLQAETLGIRVVCLRIGIVLEEGGGALEKMVLPFKLFVGGPLGSGRQWLPWIHRDDLVRAVLFILNEKTIRGPVNGTAPMPVTMKQFSQTLGSVLRRPSWAPVPGFVLKIVVGEFSDSLLAGQKALPVKLQNAGFRFTFDELHAALRDIFIKK